MTASERSRVEAMARRPRSRKQGYRALALLAVNAGEPIEAVARRYRVGVERVEAWMEAFEARRLRYLAEPDAAGARRRTRRGKEEEAEGLA
ncbi:MAG: hypothetical protein U0790_18025 [Isosphaeraceae bacterium]